MKPLVKLSQEPKARSSSARQPSRSGLRASANLSLLLVSDSLLLPRRRRLGERRRPLSRLRPTLCRRRASTKYARPFSFLQLCETEHPNTLTKLFVFGSESSNNMLPTNFDSCCKNYRVYMCTLMSYAGSSPAQNRGLCAISILI